MSGSRAGESLLPVGALSSPAAGVPGVGVAWPAGTWPGWTFVRGAGGGSMPLLLAQSLFLMNSTVSRE